MGCTCRLEESVASFQALERLPAQLRLGLPVKNVADHRTRVVVRGALTARSPAHFLYRNSGWSSVQRLRKVFRQQVFHLRPASVDNVIARYITADPRGHAGSQGKECPSHDAFSGCETGQGIEWNGGVGPPGAILRRWWAPPGYARISPPDTTLAWKNRDAPWIGGPTVADTQPKS